MALAAATPTTTMVWVRTTNTLNAATCRARDRKGCGGNTGRSLRRCAGVFTRHADNRCAGATNRSAAACRACRAN